MAKKTGKILIVTDYFYPHWTGLSKSLYYLLQATEKTLSADVLTVRFDPSLPKQEKLFGATVYREDPLFRFSRAKYSAALLWRFVRLLSDYDTVLLNSPNTNVLPLAVIAKLFGKRLYVFHQGDLILPKGFINSIIELIFVVSSFLSFLLADKLSTYTQDYANNSRVLRSFLTKVTPVIFPLPSVFSSPKRKAHKGIRFGFAGRFVEEKGFDILLRAIPAIVKAVPEATFLYAGELHMGYENFFERNKAAYEAVKEHVQLLGLLDEAALQKFYQSIDFLVVPSRSDCFNLVQAEAMLSGTPSLASDIPGLRFLVKQTGFGMLFVPEDADSLAKTAVAAVRRRSTFGKSYPVLQEMLERKKLTEAWVVFFSR